MPSLPESLQPLTAAKRGRLPKAVVESHQRDRILNVAIEVFAKRGYPETTVDRIVTAAKIGTVTFNSLFEGKEDCFLQAYDRTVAEARARILAAIPDDAAWPQGLRAAMQALLALMEEWPLHTRLVLVEAQAAGPAALARYDASFNELADILRGGREFSGIGDELPDSLEFATISGLFWFLQQRAAVGEAAKASKLLPEVLEIVAEPYLGPEATKELIASK